MIPGKGYPERILSVRHAVFSLFRPEHGLVGRRQVGLGADQARLGDMEPRRGRFEQGQLALRGVDFQRVPLKFHFGNRTAARIDLHGELIGEDTNPVDVGGLRPGRDCTARCRGHARAGYRRYGHGTIGSGGGRRCRSLLLGRGSDGRCTIVVLPGLVEGKEDESKREKEN